MARFYDPCGGFLGESGEELIEDPYFVDIKSYRELERRLAEAIEDRDTARVFRAETIDWQAQQISMLRTQVVSATNRWELAMRRLHERFGDGLAVHKADLEALIAKIRGDDGSGLQI